MSTSVSPSSGTPGSASGPGGGTEPARRDRSHYLYLAVVVAVLLGIAVGFIAPAFALELKPIGDAFVALIRMMIAPNNFCTIVLGGRVGPQRRPRRQGWAGWPSDTSSPCRPWRWRSGS